MTTLPSMFNMDAEGRAVRLLSTCCGNALTISRATSGDWILSPSSELTSAILANGLQELSHELAGGPTARIATALMQLIAVTRRPSWADDDMAQTYFDTLQEAMHEYPIDVVEEACVAWRKTDQGQWWPAEAELRRICNKLFEPRFGLRAQAERLLQALEAEESANERMRRPSPFAGDRCREFRNEMRKRMSEDRFNAYFHPSQIMFAGEDEILVRAPVCEYVLTTKGGDLIERLGLKLRFEPQAFARAPQRRWEDDTPEDQALTATRLQRLVQAMASGENLQALQNAGEI